MRIAMISEHASPLATLGGVDAGGQNAHVSALARAVAAAGHDVRIYTRRDDPRVPPVVPMGDRVWVMQVPAGPERSIPKDELYPYMREFGQFLVRSWRHARWTPDVVHAHFWMSGAAALHPQRALSLPLVQTYHALGIVKRRHQGSADTSPAERIGVERLVGRRANRVVAQCSDEVHELIHLGLDPARLEVISSGVDTGEFTPDGPAAPKSGRPRILSVGRLVERKGHADLIRAMTALPGAELIIVGGPPESELDADPVASSLRALAASCGVADRVRLVGGRSLADMPAWYRSADVVASAAWYEPFGLTPLEAMATGTPVVAYAVGGLLDSVVNRVTGLLVPPRDIRALASALRRVLDEPRRRQGYAAAGIRRARGNYDWSHIGARMSTLYRSVAADARPVTVPVHSSEPTVVSVT